MLTRALDDEHHAALIREYLSSFGSASRREIEAFLVAKLPDALTLEQKSTKVHNLLAHLRRDGQIRSVGAARSARWELISQ